MQQGRVSWHMLPGCVPRPWAQFGFQEGLLGLAIWSWGNVCLHPFPWREALGLASHFSIRQGLGSLSHLPVPKAQEGSGQSSPSSNPHSSGALRPGPLAHLHLCSMLLPPPSGTVASTPELTLD